MRRFISISAETRKVLMNKYNVTTQTIWEACSFITRNKRGDNIRHDAIEMGGRYTEEDFIPNCETTFETDGMHQRFAAGVEVTLVGNCLSLLIPDKEPERYYDTTVTTWPNVLERAQRIAEERKLQPVIQ